jgi:hypothetical protein
VSILELTAAFDAKMAANVDELKEEFDTKMEAKVLELVQGFVDPRLSFFNVESSTDSRFSDAVKEQIRTLRCCMACGLDADSCSNLGRELTCAHILSVKKKKVDCNVHFGITANYKTDVKPTAQQNAILLCGRRGVDGSCHDLYDTNVISMFYSPEDSKYKWYRLNSLNECFDGETTKSAHGFAEWLTTKENEKYRRLLAWRTLNLLSKIGNTDISSNVSLRAGFIDYLKRSEEEECDD